MLRATKLRLYPTDEQAAFLNAQFGAVRLAYNKALHIKSHYYRFYGVSLNPKKRLKTPVGRGEKIPQIPLDETV